MDTSYGLKDHISRRLGALSLFEPRLRSRPPRCFRSVLRCPGGFVISPACGWDIDFTSRPSHKKPIICITLEAHILRVDKLDACVSIGVGTGPLIAVRPWTSCRLGIDRDRRAFRKLWQSIVSHSIEFKRQIAQEFIAGETLHGLAKRHDG